MSHLEIDFGQIEERKLIPDGQVKVEIESVELRDSQSSEYQYWNWKVNVVEGEHAGTTLYFVSTLKPTMLWRLARLLKAVGVPVQGKFTYEVEEGTNFIVEPQLSGKQVMAKVKTGTWNGEKRNEVDDLLPIAAAASNGAPTARGRAAVR